MKIEYTILLVEDQPDDAELIELELSKSELDIDIIRIQSLSGLKEFLEHDNIDLVISDYDLGDFNGEDVLGIVKDHSPDLPFVLVSGFLGVKKSVEIMVAGANDFVMKDELDRLRPAVYRELSHFDQYKKQKVLLKDAYSLAKIGHWEINVETNQVYWSEEVKQIHEVEQDYSPTLEETIAFFEKGYHRRHITEQINQAIQRFEGYEIDAEIVTAKGNKRWIRSIGKPKIINGKCAYLYGSVQNITNRKKAELELKKAEKKLRDIVEHSTNLFYCHDTNHKFTYVSLQSEHFFGCSPEQAMHSWKEFLTDHPINKKGIKRTQKAIETGETQPSYKLQLQRKDGSPIWVRVNEAPVVEEGQTVEIVGSLTDITDLVRAHEEQQMLAKLARETPNVVIITNTDHHIEWVNEAFENVTGYPFEEIKGKTPDFLSGPKTDVKTEIHIHEHLVAELDKKGFYTTELLNYTKDGDPYWVEVTFTAMRDDSGWITKFFSIQEDVTERKNFLERLKTKQRRLQEAQRMGKIGDWNFDVESGEIFWSDQLYNIYERESSLGPPSYEELLAYYPDGSETHDQMVRQAIQSGGNYEFEMKLVTEKGTKKWIYAQGFTKTDEDGNTTQLYGTVQDITVRKQNQDQLKRRSERLEEAQQIGKIGDWDYDLQTGGVNWSNMLFEIFERDPLLGAPGYEQNINYYFQQKEFFEKSVRLAIEEGIPYSYDIKIKTEKENVKYVHLEGIPAIDENGNVESLHGIVQDITDRKEYELQNIAKEKQIRSVTDNVEAVLFRYILKPDGTDQMIYISESIKNIFNVSPDEAMNSTEFVWNQIHEKDIDRIRHTVQQSAETLTLWDTRFRIKSSTGELKWLQGRGNPTAREDGTIQWDTILMDITKQVEQEQMNETLVQEVHHRVKNNLAIITGLLELQLADLEEDRRERLPLERAMTRIYAIAEVHKLLHEGSQLMDVNVKEYMDNLVDHVTATMKIDGTFKIDLQVDRLQMNVNELTPLGMLMNELLTNSMKYAFNDKIQGKIIIRITKEEDTYEVLYKDDGPGIGQMTFEKAQTSGLNIAKILLDQLEAEYQLLNEGGFALSFSFQQRTKGAHGNIGI